MGQKKNPHAVALGRLGGKAKSAKKAATARRNGRKGGRPKKKDAQGTGRFVVGKKRLTPDLRVRFFPGEAWK